MIRYDESKVYNIPKNSLSSFSDFALTVPFAGMTSTMRQHMWHSHLSQIIIPDNAERPLIDTPYTKDILFSSDNTLLEGNITLVDKIEKVINGYVCNTTYIYYDHTKEQYFVEKHGKYRKSAKYFVPVKSQFDDMEIGETKNDIYASYIESMDVRDGGIAFGRNISVIYDIDKNVGEDSIVISEELANSLRVHPAYDPVEIKFNPREEILLDRYGYIDDNGIIHYQPFPLPGEKIKDGEVAVVSKVAKDFLASSDDIVHNSDIGYYVLGGEVTDIEVYSNNVIDNPFLENLRQANLDYFRNIVIALNKLDPSRMSLQAKSYQEKLSKITTEKLRFGTEELKKAIKIRITIAGDEPITPGAKITNRYGGKGTFSKVLIAKETMYDEFGRKIDAKINASGVCNRENISQQMEHSMSTCNFWLMRYLEYSEDKLEDKYKNIMDWIYILKQFNLIKLFSSLDMKTVVKYCTENYLHLKFDPFDKEVNKLMLFELVKLTKKINPEMRPLEVYENNVKLGDKFDIGIVFIVVLENGPRKDNSMRSDRINSAKGGLSRVGLDKKKFHSKYLTTAAKQSDLAQHVTITSQFDSDKKLFTPDLSQLSSSLNAIGITIGLEEVPESEE
jgi:RNA polymerase rpb2, domain 6